MPSLEEIKAQLQQKYALAKKKELAYKQNPSLTTTPEAKRHYRKVGAFLFIIGLAITLMNYLVLSGDYTSARRAVIILIAANIVFVGAGLWMMLTGNNPFAKLKR